MNQTATAQNIEHLPVVEAFLSYLIDERHFSPYTSRCYGVDLRQYVDHLTEEYGITASREQERDALNRRRNSPPTQPRNDSDVVGSVDPARQRQGAVVEDDFDIRSPKSRGLQLRGDRLGDALVPWGSLGRGRPAGGIRNLLQR